MKSGFKEAYKRKNGSTKNCAKAWKRKQQKLTGKWIKSFKKLSKEKNLKELIFKQDGISYPDKVWNYFKNK
tara:strand:+ start:766 stop:978 length:213 start_codon:yes stop_codon:yes gene_type:complete